MKKRILAIALVSALMLSLAACGAKKEEPASSSASEKSSSAVSESSSAVSESSSSSEILDGPTGMAGGWMINDDDTVAPLPEDVAAAFDKALEGYAGMGFTPVAYLGSQVVAGTNYKILCKGTTVTAEPVTALKVVTVYSKLDNTAEILNVSDFDLGTIAATEESTGTEAGLAGGWTVAELPTVNLPAEAAKAFDSVTEGLVGVGYQPAALLGTQVVAGINYAILCGSTTVTAEPVNNISVMFIYEDLEGNYSINNIVDLDLAAL